MAQVHEGMVQLERARDAALAVIQSISSVRLYILHSLPS